MMRADALRAACVALLVTAFLFVLSLSGCDASDERRGFFTGVFLAVFLSFVFIPAVLRDRRRR